MRPLDGHPADRIEQHDVVDDRLERDRLAGSPPATVAGPGDATKSARPRRTWTSSARIDRATSSAVSAPSRGRPAPAARRSARRRSSSPRAATRGRRRHGSARRPARRRTRRASAPAPTASSSQMPWLATTTYGDASGSRPRMSAEAWTRSAPGKASASAIGSMTVTRQPAAAPRRRERAGDGRRADDPQERGGQMRFHVDLQRATGMAGHDQFDDAVGRGGPRPGRPSTAGAGAAGRRRSPGAPRGRRPAGRSCRRPSPRSCRPDGRCRDAPGRAEVGRRTATTVATANGRPAASSSAARTKIEREVMTA